MITRGKYIGEIVDELSTIAEQVKLRNLLGLTDLTVYAENFFRDFLNALLGTNLINLNESRSNEPGLDLGDAKARLAFQVTSVATSEKINRTLQALSDEHAKRYAKVIVLVVGKRQASYKLDAALSAPWNFDEEDVWDITALARKAVSLEIDQLQKLHRLVRADAARLKIDLEIPDENGRYPTSGFDDWEERTKPKIGTGDTFVDFCIAQGAELSAKEKEEIRSSVSQLAMELSRIPRITREFLAMLYERRERKQSKRSREKDHILYQKVAREYRGDLDGELAILEHADFVSVSSDDQYNAGPPEILMQISSNDDLNNLFTAFLKENAANFRNVIGNVDLSIF